MVKLFRCEECVGVRLVPGVMFQMVDWDPLHLGRRKVMRPNPCRGYPHAQDRQCCLPWSADGTHTLGEIVVWPGGTANLKLHALNVSHDNGHLRPLRRLVEQRHLAQIVCSLCSSLACTLAIRSILEAVVSLRALGRLWSCLLVHGAIEMLRLARCWRVYWC
jgi:hypothetical protein